jgi:hypothetical protein
MSCGRVAHLVIAGGPEVPTGSHSQVPSRPTSAGLIRRSLGTSPGVLRSWHPQSSPAARRVRPARVHSSARALDTTPSYGIAGRLSMATRSLRIQSFEQYLDGARSSHLFHTPCRRANGEVSR